jgi:predicted TIM-barrel fold metal-dependent hydrolase
MVDMHIHAVPPCLPGAGPLSPLLDEPPDVRAAAIRREMAVARITSVLAMGRLDAPEGDPLGVEETLLIARSVPGMFAIGAMDPRVGGDPAHMDDVDLQIRKGGVRALKGYLGYLHYEPGHAGYSPYYALAERHGLPVIFHTGDTWSPRAKLRFAHPLLVDEVAVDHPNVRFVLAHTGNPWMLDAAEVVYKNVNVWADLSGLAVGDEKAFASPDAGMKETLRRLARAWRYAERPNRFLFGSDWPLAPMGAYRGWVAGAVPEEYHEDVFAGNARRLFRLEG